MPEDRQFSERELKIARVLRPLGNAPMSHEQAATAASLLGVHWTTVYRLRKRFLADPVVSTLKPKAPGPKSGQKRLGAAVEGVIHQVLHSWLPKQTQLAHPLLDIWSEVRRRCRLVDLPAPGRNTVARRWREHQAAEAEALATDPASLVPPGSFAAKAPLDVVQIDHTQSDVEVVDRQFRRSIGRPWLTVAIDIATRCVVAIYVSMQRPSAATVALLISRIGLPKAAWLARVGVEVDWPMHGIPKVLHLDNAAEFKSRALRAGCSQYGIELMYRPVGRPHFGGHIERMNRTLMERLKGLPGATGNSTVGRPERRSAERSAMTLEEFEQWLCLEVAQRYHNRPHRGLMGASPASAWSTLVQASPPRLLPNDADQALQFLIQFMPLEQRTVQNNGLTLFHIRYWHPIFATWRELRKQVTVRYHPEDLSRIFARVDGRRYVEVRYADLRHPAISLWEQRAACRILRGEGTREPSERQIFAAIDKQRQIVAQAVQQTRKARRAAAPKSGTTAKAEPWGTAAQPALPAEEIDYSKKPTPFPVELWETRR